MLEQVGMKLRGWGCDHGTEDTRPCPGEAPRGCPSGGLAGTQAADTGSSSPRTCLSREHQALPAVTPRTEKASSGPSDGPQVKIHPAEAPGRRH